MICVRLIALIESGHDGYVYLCGVRVNDFRRLPFPSFSIGRRSWFRFAFRFIFVHFEHRIKFTFIRSSVTTSFALPIRSCSWIDVIVDDGLIHGPTEERNKITWKDRQPNISFENQNDNLVGFSVSASGDNGIGISVHHTYAAGIVNAQCVVVAMAANSHIKTY